MIDSTRTAPTELVMTTANATIERARMLERVTWGPYSLT
jgi:hypothetical protein